MSDLTRAQLADLDQMVKHPGYEVFRQLMLDEKEALAGEWWDTDPAKRDEVWAAQAVAHGFHVGLRNIEIRIAHELAQYKAMLNPKPVDEEQQFIEQTISPFGGLPE